MRSISESDARRNTARPAVCRHLGIMLLNMNERVSGILLAGGNSRRMGRDKRFIESGGKSFLEISVKRLSSVADEVIVVTAGAGRLELEGVKFVADMEAGIGPMMGIYTGLTAMSSERAVVNPVDTPHITDELLRRMIERSEGFDIVMPERGGRLEPLVAVYSKNVLPVMRGLLKGGERAAPHVMASPEYGLRVNILSEKELSDFGDPDLLFRNYNSPGDFNLA